MRLMNEGYDSVIETGPLILVLNYTFRCYYMFEANNLVLLEICTCGLIIFAKESIFLVWLPNIFSPKTT